MHSIRYLHFKQCILVESVVISILYFQVIHREASACNNSCPCGVLSEINSLSCFLPSNNQMLSMSSCPQNQT